MVPVFLFLISIPSCTYIFKTLLRIRDPSSVFIPFSEAETKRGACRCAIGAFSFPIGKFIRPPSTRISHFGLFPLHNTFFTAPFRQRNSRSSPRSFEWFSSQSGPLVKFLLASTFFASLLPLLLRHPLFLLRFLPSPSPSPGFLFVRSESL